MRVNKSILKISITFLLFFLLHSFKLKGQTVPDSIMIDSVYTVADQMPHFCGGEQKLLSYIEKGDTLLDLAESAIHELFHTLRLDHPFNLTQGKDTELIKIGDEYMTTENTDKNIHYNIMNYNSTMINGKRCDSFWNEKRPEYLTKGSSYHPDTINYIIVFCKSSTSG